MSSLYDILYKFREYIVLILAILASFLIIFSNDSPEVHAFQTKVVEGVSFLQRPFMLFRRFGNLEEENNRLQQQIVELSLELQKRNETTLENQRLRRLLDFRNQSQLELQAGKIINRGGSTIVNSVTIDIGSSHGVRENMAVVVADGVVGKTIQVGNSTSIVQMLTDVNFRISVKTRRTRANGILVWERENLCTMENVPKTLDIQTGDTIITSGYSDIFPEGLLVGEVVSSTNELPGYYKSIQVRAFVDFNKLEEVFVIEESPVIEVAGTPGEELIETTSGESGTVESENDQGAVQSDQGSSSNEVQETSPGGSETASGEDTTTSQQDDELEALINEAIESLNNFEEDIITPPVEQVPEFRIDEDTVAVPGAATDTLSDPITPPQGEPQDSSGTEGGSNEP